MWRNRKFKGTHSLLSTTTAALHIGQRGKRKRENNYLVSALIRGQVKVEGTGHGNMEDVGVSIVAALHELRQLLGVHTKRLGQLDEISVVPIGGNSSAIRLHGIADILGVDHTSDVKVEGVVVELDSGGHAHSGTTVLTLGLLARGASATSSGRGTSGTSGLRSSGSLLLRLRGRSGSGNLRRASGLHELGGSLGSNSSHGSSGGGAIIITATGEGDGDEGTDDSSDELHYVGK